MTDHVNNHRLVLTYQGDVSHMVGEVKGPNLRGEYFQAVEVTVAGNKSRVTFEPLRLGS